MAHQTMNCIGLDIIGVVFGAVAGVFFAAGLIQIKLMWEELKYARG